MAVCNRKEQKTKRDRDKTAKKASSQPRSSTLEKESRGPEAQKEIRNPGADKAQEKACGRALMAS
jgi:hypothetical protein